MPVDLKILEYYFLKQFILKYKIRNAKQHPSYATLMQTLKNYQPTAIDNKELADCTFTIFDLETTGFFPELGDEIISIGAVKVKHSQVQYSNSFYKVISPLQTVTKSTKRFTGLKKKEIIDGEPLPIVMSEFLQFSEGTILVAHPASFDINFLKKRFKKWGLPEFSPEYLDSFLLANKLYPSQKNYLDDLIERFSISRRTRHHALNDAVMTAEIFIQLLGEVSISRYSELKEKMV
ncbi:3'-5' exonuclease [Cytobacillus sp. S13-E01]|uniref:3'-5' exonuclease n=1 Tax=Cytobacillus sp. S13-E01 TaxID=3031326 RepID=UPI0023D81A83|nr:3'-5' exonuclease [Cytobacillus sp. S13-E01]MDF0725613.1 3'-5' exonuclease [Cytobacillus sp. S13-E01]